MQGVLDLGEQALDVVILENLQREDPHPLDEAVGYRTMLLRRDWTVDELADRVDKSAGYVAQRLELDRLIEPLRERFVST